MFFLFLLKNLKTQHFHTCMRAKSLQLCLTLCDPMDCSPPGSFVHGILQDKNTGVNRRDRLWSIFLSGGSNLRLLCLLHWQGFWFFLTTSATWKAHIFIRLDPNSNLPL